MGEFDRKQCEEKKIWQNDLKCEWLGILRNDNYYLKKRWLCNLKMEKNMVWMKFEEFEWKKFEFEENFIINAMNEIWIYTTEFM